MLKIVAILAIIAIVAEAHPVNHRGKRYQSLNPFYGKLVPTEVIPITVLPTARVITVLPLTTFITDAVVAPTATYYPAGSVILDAEKEKDDKPIKKGKEDKPKKEKEPKGYITLPIPDGDIVYIVTSDSVYVVSVDKKKKEKKVADIDEDKDDIVDEEEDDNDIE